MTPRTILSRTAGLALMVLLYAAPASAQQTAAQPEPATISVSGSGLAEAKPELARIIVSVSTQEESVPKASAANKEASDKLLARIQALAIPATDIKTLNLQVFRVYPTGKISLSGGTGTAFRAEHQIEIVLRDTGSAGRIIGDLIALDSITLQTIDWDVGNPDEIVDKARAEAVADARHRAEIYADAAGVRLGRLLTIRDDERSGAPMSYRAMAAASKGVGDNAMPIVPPATLTFSAGAQMVWEILPR